MAKKIDAHAQIRDRLKTAHGTADEMLASGTVSADEHRNLLAHAHRAVRQHHLALPQDSAPARRKKSK